MTDQTTIFSQDKLLELYEKLPQQLKDAIFSVDVADKIMKTGQKFGLNVEQTGGLAETTGLVMLGALHPRSYIQKLEETLKIDRTKAVDVAKEVNHEIFFPVREQLKKLHGMEDTEEVTGERTIERGDLLKKLAELKNKALGTRQSALGMTEAQGTESRIKSQESSKIEKLSMPQPAIPSMQKIPSRQDTEARIKSQESSKIDAVSEKLVPPQQPPSPPVRVSQALQERFGPKNAEAGSKNQEVRTTEKVPGNIPVQHVQKLAPVPTPEKTSMGGVSQALKDMFAPAPQNAEARIKNQESSTIEKMPGNIPIQKPEEKPGTAAPNLDALQNEIKSLLKKAPAPDVPTVPRPIPEWAKPAPQAQSIEAGSKNQEVSTPEKVPENLLVQQMPKPVQKIPMQEIRPRPQAQSTEAGSKNQEASTRQKSITSEPNKVGRERDKYREIIE